MSGNQARFDFTTDPSGRRVLVLEGDWTAFTISPIDRRLKELRVDDGDSTHVDVSGLQDFDTAGAYMVDRTMRQLGAPTGADILISGEHHSARDLLEVVSKSIPDTIERSPDEGGLKAMVERVGRGVVDFIHEGRGILEFIGEAVATVVRLLMTPHRIRWTSVVAVMEDAGLDALPIVAMLSFFIGLVISFLGVSLLQQFGAQVYTVEMVGVLMLREFGVVLTAILLAGRTDSAFTAQIGAMRMREEIDAMRILGLNPMEVLVAPRMLALVVMTPLLTFAATMSGIFGGMVVMWTVLDISPSMFILRIYETVPYQHFWVGMVKAPVFALVVALVGCRQGLLVSGDVQSLGDRTTSSVVQAIFLVIVIDALFAILFLELDI